MVHDTSTLDQTSQPVHPLKAAVDAAISMVGISQNEFARRAGVDESILSRVLRKKIVSDPAERKIRVQLAKMMKRTARAS